MSSVSVSVATPSKAAALKSDIANGDSVTPSSENTFSGIFDSSISATGPADADAKTGDTLESDPSAESEDETDLSSAQAENAADILMRLQISRQMDTSLQLPPQSLPTDFSHLSTGDESETATSIPADSVSSSMFSDIKSSSEAEKTFSKTINLPNNDVDAENTTPVVTDTSSGADNIAASTSADNQSQGKIDESDNRKSMVSKNNIPMPEEMNSLNNTNTNDVSPLFDLSSVVSTETAANTQAAPAVVPPVKREKSAKASEVTPVDVDTTLSSLVANSTMTNPEVKAVTNQNQTDVSSNTENAATNSSDVVVSDHKPHVRHSEQAPVTGSTLSTALTTEESTAEDSNLPFTDGDAGDTTAVSTVTNTDNVVTSDLGRSLDLGANKEVPTGSVSQENMVNTAAKNSSTAALASASSPDQAQSLRHITEQLPSVYVKNGQIDEHELSARVVLMAGQKWQEAEIQLEPQGMGKIRIQLSIDQEQQTHVQFMVQHSQAKEAIDQSMPRLRDLLSQHGLQPGQTQVQQQSQESANQSWNQQMANNGTAEQRAQRGNSSTGHATSSANDDDFVQTVTVSASDTAGIDFYA